MKYAFFKHAWFPTVFMTLLVLPVAVGAPAPAALAGSDRTDVLPLCSDPSTLQAVHAQLNEAPHVNVIGLHGAREVDVNDAPDLRTWLVGVITDLGARTTTFMVGWEDREAGVSFVAGERL